MVNTELAATQQESGALNLALLALGELAKRKSTQELKYLSKDIEIFCDAILAKDDIGQIEYLEDLVSNGVSLQTIYENFIPETAENLGNLWKRNEVTFVEVNLGTQRLQRLSRIYENRYLGPLYLNENGPDILLILPKGEVHTLGIITASGIFKKNGANPFIAVGYSNTEIIALLCSREFKLVGLSISNVGHLTSCIETAKAIRCQVKYKIPIVLGGQAKIENHVKKDSHIFDITTSDPKKALNLIKVKK